MWRFSLTVLGLNRFLTLGPQHGKPKIATRGESHVNEVEAASEFERMAARLAAPKNPGHLGAHVVLAGSDPARLDR